jgi:hypothetical protein
MGSLQWVCCSFQWCRFLEQLDKDVGWGSLCCFFWSSKWTLEVRISPTKGRRCITGRQEGWRPSWYDLGLGTRASGLMTPCSCTRAPTSSRGAGRFGSDVPRRAPALMAPLYNYRVHTTSLALEVQGQEINNHKFTTSKRLRKIKVINDDNRACAERRCQILEWNSSDATMLIHPVKAMKAASGREHPQAMREYPLLCWGRGPSQEHLRHVLHQQSSSRQHSLVWHQSLGSLASCGTHPPQHAPSIHSGLRSNGIDTELSESGTQVHN